MPLYCHIRSYGLPFLMMLVISVSAAAQTAVQPPKTIGAVHRKDRRIDMLISPDAKIELLATGFEWSEGPVWVREGNCIIFSDVPRNTIFRWSEKDGLSEYLHPSGYTGDATRGGEPGSNGLAIDAQRRLILCQHGDRRVARMDQSLLSPAARFQSVADRYEGKRFNSPNDLAIHSSGAIYFTDPPYGLEGGFEDPKQEIPFQGVYRVGVDGVATLLIDSLRAPNGLAFSPDEATLYVAQSAPEAAIWMAYRVREDGGVEQGRILADAKALQLEGPGLPDGMKVDRKGTLFATGPGGVVVLDSEGQHLGTISTGEAISNCALTDDGKYLYMTSDMHLCRVALQ